MRTSYRTLQVPRKGAGAFAPTMTVNATASANGANQVYGAPGTVAVPSPRPAALADGELGGPYNQPSAVVPDVIFPAIYYAVMNRGLHFPGRLLSDHVLPVPAGAIGRTAAPWHHRTRVGGQTATAARRPFTRWPVYGGN